MNSTNIIDRKARPAVYDVPLLPIPGVKRQRLSNGIEIITLADDVCSDIVRMTFSWEGGGYDAPSLPAAEIATQLIQHGCNGMSDGEMADMIDFTGAILSSDLSNHNNSLTLVAPERNLIALLSAVVNSINDPLMPVNELSTLKERLAAARATDLERVTARAMSLDTRLSFGDSHPAAREYTPDEMRQISIEDVKLAHEFLKGHQPPAVFIVGSVSHELQTKTINELSRLNCTSDTRGHVSIIPPISHSGNLIRHFEMPAALQSAIRITIPTISRSHNDYQQVRLMTMALGGYFGSRLMTNIREKQGLTYGINAGVYGYREGAFISISCQCDNRYVNRVIEEVGKEIENLSTEPMDNDELLAVKQTAISSLISTLDTPFNVMDYYVLQRHLQTPDDYFERQQKAISQLNAQTIIDTAQKYLINKPMLISTAGAAQSL